jgi:hypothetical protein
MGAGRRAWIAGALVGLLLAAASATATAAEPGASPDVPGVVSAVTGVSPPGAPLSARVTDGAGGVEVTVQTPQPVEILGYQREPYLLFEGGVVYENRRSPSTYVNAAGPTRAIPALDQLRGPPEWAPVGSGPSWRWHDHRTHFGTRPSARMLAEPSAGFRIKRWRLLARADGRRVEIAGSLDYRPAAGASAAALSSSPSPPASTAGGLGPAGYGLLVAGQVVLVAGILLALRARRRRRLASSRAPIA